MHTNTDRFPVEEQQELFDLAGARDSTQYDFTVEEALEMRERAAVEQQQMRELRLGNTAINGATEEVAV